MIGQILDQDTLALLRPAPPGLDAALAFRLPGIGVWLLQDPQGAFYAFRALPCAEGWLRLPEGMVPHAATADSPATPLVGPDGIPLSLDCLVDLGIEQPPGGGYEAIYGIPNHPSTIWAASPDGDFRMKLDDENQRWVKIATYYSDSPNGPWESPGERPDAEVSVRIQHLRQARREARA